MGDGGRQIRRDVTDNGGLRWSHVWRRCCDGAVCFDGGDVTCVVAELVLRSGW